MQRQPACASDGSPRWRSAGRRTLIVRVPAGNGGEGPAAILEVWGASRLLSEVQVPRGLHGSVYNDGWFADGAAWSPDEARVAYVAEVSMLI